MSLKFYGIYLAYAPTVDLRHEGLGRYLAAFLKGAAGREDVRFVLVCPSWSREGLEELFKSEGVSKVHFQICSPRIQPLVLRGYNAYQVYKNRPRKPSLRQRFTGWVHWIKEALLRRAEHHLIRAHFFSDLLPLLLSFSFLAIFALLLSPLILTVALIYCFVALVHRSIVRIIKPLSFLKAKVQRALGNPKDDGFVLRLYQQMEVEESKRLLQLIDDMPHVLAWYSPTAFWPAFNEIRAPKLMCVPDVVLIDFSIGFSDVGGDRFLANFE